GQLPESVLMEQTDEILNCPFKKSFPQDKQIKPFPAQGNEVKPEQTGNGLNGRGDIGAAGKDFQTCIEMPGNLVVVAGDLPGRDVRSCNFIVKEQPCSRAQRTI